MIKKSRRMATNIFKAVSPSIHTHHKITEQKSHMKAE